MVPWVFIYGINILLMFASSIVMFYSLSAGYKALGLVPLFSGVFVLFGHFAVIFFVIEQRADLDIYLAQGGSEAVTPS